MLTTFGQIKSNFKLKPQAYIIDNWVFRLHYRASVLLFLVCTLLVTSRQYIGEHIRCIADSGVPEHVMNTFCYFTSTFTVIKHLDADLLDKENLAHPGVGPYGINSEEPIIRHAYYQWVPFVLFGQSIMFYLTRILWKKWEGGRVKYLVDGLKLAAFSLEEKEMDVGGSKIPSKQQRKERIEIIKDAFLQRVYLSGNWSVKLMFCEILNFLNVILQFYITDVFLGGYFKRLGPKIWTEGLASNVDILDEVFPKVTKCTFHKYGPSGSIQSHDAMCVMALNIINEKIYSILWFWFIFLFICSSIGLLWRACTIILHSRSRRFNKIVFANAYPGKNPFKNLEVTYRRNFTDWLFLSYLAKNIDGLVFREIFIGLGEKMQEKEQSKEALINLEDEKSL